MPRSAPTNFDDVIDSRDVIARIQELQDERDDAISASDWAQNNPDDAAELAALEALQSEAEGCADWQHGETLIRDSYFERYAQELAEDIGAINSEATWPNDCIDWGRAARELQMDYTSVSFDGVDYWVRS